MIAGSVSPFAQLLGTETVLEDKGDSEDLGESPGEVGERLGLERDDEVIRELKDPKLPSQGEVGKHWLMGHLPYRDWCHICVQAKAKDMAHKRDKGSPRGLPEYSWDYCFPGDEFGFRWTVFWWAKKGRVNR